MLTRPFLRQVPLHPRRRWLPPGLAALALLVAGFHARPAAADDEDDDEQGHGPPCEQVARALRSASTHAAQDEYWVGVATCLDLTDPRASRECLRGQHEALAEALEEIREQYRARLELCDALGGGAYAPRIDPRDFESDVDHPFFPLVPGITKVFEQHTQDGTEHIEVTVTGDRRSILGVECVVVRDTATLDGELIEDTLDYYAQDRAGNVWYFGELAMNYEDGLLHDLDGSWIAGEQGARPGLIMEALPLPGDVYRQELLPNEAEDAARVTGLGREVSVVAGHFADCLETFDFSPLEPELQEAKFYAPGLGVVLEIDLVSGERLELVGVF